MLLLSLTARSDGSLGELSCAGVFVCVWFNGQPAAITAECSLLMTAYSYPFPALSSPVPKAINELTPPRADCSWGHYISACRCRVWTVIISKSNSQKLSLTEGISRSISLSCHREILSDDNQIKYHRCDTSKRERQTEAKCWQTRPDSFVC